MTNHLFTTRFWTASMKIEIQNVVNDHQKRVDAHSHIKKLGLNEDGSAKPEGDGFIGQCAAREACGVVAQLIREKKLAGRCLLLAGPPGSGKTALAIGLSHELGDGIPFSHLIGSEVYSSEVKKTEILMEHFRRAIGLRIKERKEVYEGEVVEINPVVSESSTGDYSKVITRVNITLKSRKGTTTLKLDPSVHRQLEKEGVRPGDVIYIEANSGAVRRVGRSDRFAGEFELECETYVPVPKGAVHKRRDVVQEVTLHDLDAANARPQGGHDAASLLAQLGALGAPRKTEITGRLRAEVDAVVGRYVDGGVAELAPGVLFIDEAHMLDIECFAFLNRALESPLAPFVIFATNRGLCEVRGTESLLPAGHVPEGTMGAGGAILAPHGMPLDLLDRLLIVRVAPYSAAEVRRIVEVRASAELCAITPEALDCLADAVASGGSLRHAMALLGAARVVASSEEEEYGEEETMSPNTLPTVTAEHVRSVRELFLSARESALRLQNNTRFLM